MNRLRLAIVLAVVAVAWPSSPAAQSTLKRDVLVVARYAPGTPSAAGDGTSQSAVFAQTLSTKAVGWLIKNRGCYKVMTDKIVQASLAAQKADLLLGGSSGSISEIAAANS